MNFAVLSMEIPITNQLQIVCHFSFDPNGNVDPNESLIQKSNVIRDKALRKDLSLGLKICVFPLTCRKKLGSVGWKIFLFFYKFLFIKLGLKCFSGLHFTKTDW